MELSVEDKHHALAEYVGKLKNSRMEGDGKYWFDSGTRYEGSFKDGMFHGDGVLHFSNGIKYFSKWENGKAIDGNYVFPDGLEFKNDDDVLSGWRYCNRVWDRRFYKEMTDGLRPVDHSMLSADADEKGKPSREIPVDCYDCGDGYYNPKERIVYQYREDWIEDEDFTPSTTKGVEQAHKFLRNVTTDEHDWIIQHCRKGRDDHVGCQRLTNYDAEKKMSDAIGRLSLKKQGCFRKKYGVGKVLPNATNINDSQTNSKKSVKFSLS